jgi:hypothetical protein
LQAHVVLEAPDRERLTLTFRDARAQTLVRSDVIALAPKTGIPPDSPETALGDYLIPTPVRLGKTRWWKEWVKQEGNGEHSVILMLPVVSVDSAQTPDPTCR